MLSMSSKLKFMMKFPFNTKLFKGVVVVLKNQSTLNENPEASFLEQRLGYLADIFSLLNELSISPEGSGLNVVTAN